MENGSLFSGNTKIWNFAASLHRIVEILRTEGVRTLGLKILLETIYRRMFLFERLLNGPAPRIDSPLPVVFSLLGTADIPAYCKLAPDDKPLTIHRRLAAGQLCFAARLNDRIVHARWAVTREAWISYLNSTFHLAPDEVYIYASYTACNMRGRNISPACATWMIEHFKRRGFRRLLAVVLPENKPGLQSAHKSGYHQIGTLGYVKIAAWRHDFFRAANMPSIRDKPSAGSATAYWNGIGRHIEHKSRYMDPFLCRLKRNAYLKLIEQWGETPSGGRVLKTDLFDEATESGAFLADLAENSNLAVGIDISTTIVRQARQRGTEKNAAYTVSDIRHLPFADGVFSLIVSPSTLDHFPDSADLHRSLRELQRTLAPGGKLIITLDNRQNIFDPMLRFAAGAKLLPFYIGRSYRVAELRRELVSAGLQVLDTTAILHNPRFMAVATMWLTQKLPLPFLKNLTRNLLLAIQNLEKTRWCYYSGSFVAALTVAPKQSLQHRKQYSTER